MKLHHFTSIPLTIILLVLTISPAPAITQTEEKIEEAMDVFEAIMSDPDRRIPSALLRNSEAIAIIPDVVQAGFFFGGRRGTGVMLGRYPDGSWTNPAFVNLTGGSFGLQFGAKSSDIILVFPNRSALREVMSGSFELGGSVSGTAGPVGETAVESREGIDDDPIYTYSRSKGLFGGVALEGSELGFNQKKNREFYGRYVTPRQIFSDRSLPAPVVVNSLRRVLGQSETGRFSRY